MGADVSDGFGGYVGGGVGDSVGCGVGDSVGGYVGGGVGVPWALTSATASVNTSAMESETLWVLTSATASVDTSRDPPSVMVSTFVSWVVVLAPTKRDGRKP